MPKIDTNKVQHCIRTDPAMKLVKQKLRRMKLEWTLKINVRDFPIRSNTNRLGLQSNAIKDLCPLSLHQLVVGWIGKAHGLTSGIKAQS